VRRALPANHEAVSWVPQGLKARSPANEQVQLLGPPRTVTHSREVIYYPARNKEGRPLRGRGSAHGVGGRLCAVVPCRLRIEPRKISYAVAVRPVEFGL